MSANAGDHRQFQVQPNLINPNADDCAKRLMAYLCDTYGRSMLTGQQIGVVTTPEMDFIYRETGKYPAVGGFDFMNDSPSRLERGAVGTDTELALKWWEEGGIVTFCWHWNAPKDLVDQPPDNGWHRGFYTSATTFDLAAAMEDPDSEDYRLLLRDIDAISGLLAKLRDAGIPVLWRPLHEASGGWFWWGAKGPQPCIQLWKLMVDRMTRVHGLHNLIWVWNGQHKDWYPGDEYVDIIGEDVYVPERNYVSNEMRFRQALDYTSVAKIIALSENGPLPDPDRMVADGALWAWNCTWYGDFVKSEQFTDWEMLRKVYNHAFTLTRDELPDLRNYPLPVVRTRD
ncbi:glycosyl hydrolase [Paenibacillus sp. CF384]|uniref:glycosyl hydrolase n=1 Tax=Paenibacillus sp. CF384 TaxID=1884382 RepID=UPI000899D29F|nr:glycosyl hydrolase [Paenibacillus sp. CF384]SDW24848.1 mannan endo-1,4-beta-mannosidase [Paenibacillus sp. CF384]